MHSIQMLLVDSVVSIFQVPIKTKVIFEADFVPMLWDFDCDFISVQSGKLINNHDTFFEEYCKYDMSDSIT